MVLKKFLNLETSLYIIVGSFVSALAFWYQISPLTFNQYKALCTSNYGNNYDFTRCMNPYWSQYPLNQLMVYISLGFSAMGLMSLIISKLFSKS
jgi:hypothetical protein